MNQAGLQAPPMQRPIHMSKVIEVDGVFIGAALMLLEDRGWRFVSAHRRTSEADGCVAPTLQDTRMLARRAFFTSRDDRVLS